MIDAMRGVAAKLAVRLSRARMAGDGVRIRWYEARISAVTSDRQALQRCLDARQRRGQRAPRTADEWRLLCWLLKIPYTAAERRDAVRMLYAQMEADLAAVRDGGTLPVGV